MVVFFIVYYHSCTASSYCIVRLEMGHIAKIINMDGVIC